MTLLDGRSRSALAPCRSDGDALDAGLAAVCDAGVCAAADVFNVGQN